MPAAALPVACPRGAPDQERGGHQQQAGQGSAEQRRQGHGGISGVLAGAACSLRPAFPFRRLRRAQEAIELPPRPNVSGVEPNRGFVVGDGVAGPSQFDQHTRKIPLGVGQPGIEPDRFGEMVGGRFELAQFGERGAEIALGLDGPGASRNAASNWPIASCGR